MTNMKRAVVLEAWQGAADALEVLLSVMGTEDDQREVLKAMIHVGNAYPDRSRLQVKWKHE